MNVEMFFVQSEMQTTVSELIRQRLRLPPDPAGQQPDCGLPSSYVVLLATDPKRTVAVSPPIGGWIAGVESKEVVDLSLLLHMSETLATHVIAVQLSEVTGSCGYALCVRGIVSEHRFSDDDPDPAGTVSQFLRRNGVQMGLVSFRDAVEMRSQSWVIIK
jgi:hypothetical protein